VRRTKFHIATGTTTKVTVRVSRIGVQFYDRVTERDVIFTEQDVKEKYDWGYEFYLPDSMHPEEAIFADNEDITIELE